MVGETGADVLAVALSDQATQVREEVVYALGRVGGAKAFRFLEQALADPDESVRDAAAQVIAELLREAAFEP